MSKNNAVFLAIVLVAGTISTIVPTTTFAQSQYNNVPQQENKGYEDSYGKDYDKKKSSGLNLQKVKCNNIIINGVDSVRQGTAAYTINGMADEE